MIKNTIIVILLLLLLITFYAYICLSSNMIDFQKDRMQHIIKKEKELKYKEQKLFSMEKCNDNLNKYKLLINKISSDLEKTTSEINVLSKYANQINTSINKDLANGYVKTDIETTVENIIQSEKSIENFENTHKDILDLPIDEGFITGLDD